MSISQIITESKLDTELAELGIKINENSWSTSQKDYYYPFRHELSTVGPIILRGNRIVIPSKLRTQTLELAHEGHPGETVMKRRQKGKEKEDEARRSKENHISIGDKVLVQNVVIPNKLIPWFGSAEYEVLEKVGNEVTLAKEGKIIKRHITHVRKLPETSDTEVIESKTTMQENKEETNKYTTQDKGSRCREEENPPTGQGISHTKVEPLKLKKKEGMWRPVVT